VTNLEFKEFPFERIAIPTLVVNAADDRLAPYAYAKARSQRILGVRFVTWTTAATLLLGQQERVNAELSAFVSSAFRPRCDPQRLEELTCGAPAP